MLLSKDEKKQFKPQITIRPGPIKEAGRAGGGGVCPPKATKFLLFR